MDTRGKAASTPSMPSRHAQRCQATDAVVAGRVMLQSGSALPLRVLVVEDSLDNQRLILHLLRRRGAEVDIAENGREGVDKALMAHERGQAFDVVLMDIQMPVMDGQTATRVLRSRGYPSPIVALTAHATPGSRERCLAAGCSAFATKPFNIEDLVALINDVVVTQSLMSVEA